MYSLYKFSYLENVTPVSYMDQVSAIHRAMCHENQVCVHTNGIPWLIWLTINLCPRVIPIPSAAGVCQQKPVHVLMNPKSRPSQEQLPGPKQDHRPIISIPECSRVPTATKQATNTFRHCSVYSHGLPRQIHQKPKLTCPCPLQLAPTQTPRAGPSYSPLPQLPLTPTPPP